MFGKKKPLNVLPANTAEKEVFNPRREKRKKKKEGDGPFVFANTEERDLTPAIGKGSGGRLLKGE